MTEIEGVQVYRADRFVEKPSEEKAREYLEDGRYLWNSGMFIVQANHALKLFARHLPSHYALLIEIQNSLGTPHERQTTEDAYGRFERISIDFGIMEHANDVAVIRGDFGWLDVGTWPSLDLVSKHDARGNIVRGNHVGIGTERCIIRSGGTLVATLGVHDLVVIETPDAVLVCSKSHAQDVRDVVQRLQESGRSSAL
jgi:mannose-1-phosphate guanylyltransferase